MQFCLQDPEYNFLPETRILSSSTLKMAASAAAALLDELMGRNRNLAPSDERTEVRWDDPEVVYVKTMGLK